MGPIDPSVETDARVHEFAEWELDFCLLEVRDCKFTAGDTMVGMEGLTPLVSLTASSSLHRYLASAVRLQKLL